MSNNATTETPAAGNDGQALFYTASIDKYQHKTAGQARALIGATPSSWQRAATGDYLLPAGVTSVVTGATSQGYLRFIPIIVPVAITGATLAIEITSAALAGGVARLGLYTPAANNAPGSLLIDAGTVATTVTSTTPVEASLGSLALQPGLYWGCFVAQVQDIPGTRAASGIKISSTAGYTYGNTAYRSAANTFTGALPATAPTALGDQDPWPLLTLKVG